ncbi:hypothetical protein [Variovorax sp. UC122_21]|uniref:hypothetical protein n=1 Tax=Variovorax sp. UC122_21 TaxID=3374554 RepID=UPI0037575ACB
MGGEHHRRIGRGDEQPVARRDHEDAAGLAHAAFEQVVEQAVGREVGGAEQHGHHVAAAVAQRHGHGQGRMVLRGGLRPAHRATAGARGREFERLGRELALLVELPAVGRGERQAEREQRVQRAALRQPGVQRRGLRQQLGRHGLRQPLEEGEPFHQVVVDVARHVGGQRRLLRGHRLRQVLAQEAAELDVAGGGADDRHHQPHHQEADNQAASGFSESHSGGGS